MLRNYVLGVIAVLSVVGLIVLWTVVGVNVAADNNKKVQNMTSLCVAHGYKGWTDDGCYH